MTTIPYKNCYDDIRNVFKTNWTHDPDVFVTWSDDWAKVTVPDTAKTWLNLDVLFVDETLVAFGSGRFQNEMALEGVVDLTCFGKVGSGNADLLTNLSKAVAVFRSRRQDSLSFLGSATMLDTSPRIGIWRGRSAMIPFRYRFKG